LFSCVQIPARLQEEQNLLRKQADLLREIYTLFKPFAFVSVCNGDNADKAESVADEKRKKTS